MKNILARNASQPVAVATKCSAFVWLRAALITTLVFPWVGMAAADTLASAPVREEKNSSIYVAEGVVEAIRQTVVSTQVPGVINKLAVKAGDAVKSGQLLLQIDARTADQLSIASSANAEAARTGLEVAKKDYERQKQLYEKEYISQAAMERADAQYRASEAKANATKAQAVASRTQSGFYALAAPYAGLVSDVDVTVGDMAMPGRTLLTVYDPEALRVTATVPQAQIAGMIQKAKVRIEIPTLPENQRWYEASSSKVLPKADASTHTMQIRLDLPIGNLGLPPGTFARVHLPTTGRDGQHLFVPTKAVFQRAELTAIYVIDEQGTPHLRQVKRGSIAGDEIEVLAGVAVGERVALDPIAASRHR
ncbi:MAG: efflux RND transporter periplasmic adaptor subunit [Betaproteobacteria bacterium]